MRAKTVKSGNQERGEMSWEFPGNPALVRGLECVNYFETQRSGTRRISGGVSGVLRAGLLTTVHDTRGNPAFGNMGKMVGSIWETPR